MPLTRSLKRADVTTSPQQLRVFWCDVVVRASRAQTDLEGRWAILRARRPHHNGGKTLNSRRPNQSHNSYPPQGNVAPAGRAGFDIVSHRPSGKAQPPAQCHTGHSTGKTPFPLCPSSVAGRRRAIGVVLASQSTHRRPRRWCDDGPLGRQSVTAAQKAGAHPPPHPAGETPAPQRRPNPQPWTATEAASATDLEGTSPLRGARSGIVPASRSGSHHVAHNAVPGSLG